MNAQEQIIIWLLNDRAVLEYARAVIDGEEPYGDESPRVALKYLVNDLLYADSGSFYRSLCQRIPGGYQGSNSAMQGLKECISRDDLDSVNWEEVANEVKAD